MLLLWSICHWQSLTDRVYSIYDVNVYMKHIYVYTLVYISHTSASCVHKLVAITNSYLHKRACFHTIDQAVLGDLDDMFASPQAEKRQSYEKGTMYNGNETAKFEDIFATTTTQIGDSNSNDPASCAHSPVNTVKSPGIAFTVFQDDTGRHTYTYICI